MKMKPNGLIGNRLLAGLPVSEYKLALKHSEEVELVLGATLSDSGRSSRYVYFPLSGLISLTVNIDDETTLGVAMIGSEGMLGASQVLGVGKGLLRGTVQAAGRALRMDVDRFETLTRSGARLKVIVERYLFVLIMHLNITAACTNFHEVANRLARCLLMAHDRSQGNTFFLTQQLLSEILGVQRSAVSIAAAALQARHLIAYSRGHITVLDRTGLESAACSCYAAMAHSEKRYLAVAFQ
jgi:CRP-like cAMP-binding protein